MDDEPYFTPGKTILWQQLHRSIRLRAYSTLINRRISYRTYFMCDNQQPPAILDVVGIVELRTRGAGRDRAFIGLDPQGALHEIPWMRIVEVTLLGKAEISDPTHAD